MCALSSVHPPFSPKRTALLVEDDENLRQVLENHLERAGYAVRLASGELDAVRQADGADVAIVDLGLAQGGGAGVCARIRGGNATSTVPVLVLGADGDLETKLRLFAAGADDYITKPFEPLELLARIEVAVRRGGGRRKWPRVGPLEVSDGGDVVLNGTPLVLTAAERDVIGRLAASYPGTASHEVLRRAPWRRSGESSDNVIEVVVGRIRKKLAAAGGGVEVHAVRRAGYALRLAPTEATGPDRR